MSNEMENFGFIENDWFIKKYFNNLGSRFWTFKAALNLFLQMRGSLIVETGTLRLANDWGGGCSTFIFGDFCKRYNKRLITVDILSDNIDTAKRETKEFSEVITYVVGDSVAYLKNLSEVIDFLYLDSMDCSETGDSSAAQEHQLKEFKVALNKLAPNAIILLDDSNFPGGGKTKLTKRFLIDNGFKLIMDYQQCLFLKI